MKKSSQESAVERLTSAEAEFAEIERLTKELRRRLDRVAENIRIVAGELRRANGKR